MPGGPSSPSRPRGPKISAACSERRSDFPFGKPAQARSGALAVRAPEQGQLATVWTAARHKGAQRCGTKTNLNNLCCRGVDEDSAQSCDWKHTRWTTWQQRPVENKLLRRFQLGFCCWAVVAQNSIVHHNNEAQTWQTKTRVKRRKRVVREAGEQANTKLQR